MALPLITGHMEMAELPQHSELRSGMSTASGQFSKREHSSSIFVRVTQIFYVSIKPRLTSLSFWKISNFWVLGKAHTWESIIITGISVK